MQSRRGYDIEMSDRPAAKPTGHPHETGALRPLRQFRQENPPEVHIRVTEQPPHSALIKAEVTADGRALNRNQVPNRVRQQLTEPQQH